MRNLKILTAAILATGALTITGTADMASATVLYSGASKLPAKTELTLTLKSGSSSEFSSPEGEVLNTCTKSQIQATTSNAGGATETVKASATRYEIEGCLFLTVIISTGELEFHYSSGLNALITTKGFKVRFLIPLFGECVYGSGTGMTLGTLTGSTSGSASLGVNAILSRESGSAFACPLTSHWVATLITTSPKPFHATAS